MSCGTNRGWVFQAGGARALEFCGRGQLLHPFHSVQLYLQCIYLSQSHTLCVEKRGTG